MTDLSTQLGRGRPRIQLMALSTLPHHGWYPQSQADLEFVSLDGRRKTSSYLPTLSLFPGVQPEAASFPESVKDPVCWGNTCSVGCTGGQLWSACPPQVRAAPHGAASPCL